MTHYILLIISTALINNFVLVKFLGLCPFMGVSKKIETAIGMGLATTFVLTVASLCSYLVDNYILMPLNATFLRTLVFILVIAVVVQFTEMVINKTSPSLYRLLGIFLPLIYIALAYTGTEVLSQAAIVTLSLFGGLTAVVFMTRLDFSFLRSVLVIGGFLSLGLIVAGALFGFELGLWFSIGMVVLAAGGILYQTYNVKNEYTTDQYVGAALQLFSSVMLLFWYILRIFLSRRD